LHSLLNVTSVVYIKIVLKQKAIQTKLKLILVVFDIFQVPQIEHNQV